MKHFKKLILSGILLAFTVAFFVIIRASDHVIFGATLPQGAAVFETSLQSPITSAATSMTLTANSVRGGSALSGYNCFTVDEGSAQAEYICGTVSGTTVSSLTRGVDPLTATTTTTSLKFAHRRGANVKITNFPLLQIIRNQLNGNDTFSNIISYASNQTFSSSTQLVSKKYVDDTAFGSTPVIVSAGGTGQTSLPQNVLLFGNGTGAIGATTSPTVGWITATTSTATSNFAGGVSFASTTSFAGTNTFNGAVVFNSSVSGNGLSKFGGTGSDGALSITSGTTTIDLANASVFVRNYTTISITGTGALAFINPNAAGTVIILKSQGNVTLTSSATPNIDASGLGGSGGSAGAASGGTGGNGTQSPNILDTNSHFGTGAVGSTAGTVGSALTKALYATSSDIVNTSRTTFIIPGPGGGGGAGGANASGAIGTAGTIGGRGGAGLIIEAGGAWNFTKANGISVAGQSTVGAASGQKNGGGTPSAGSGGSGGGGAGGMFLGMYNTLTANSGTININGGVGATGTASASGDAGTGGVGGGAGAGGSLFGSGTAGTNGGSPSPTQTGGTGGTGGNGASGLSIVMQNIIF